MKKKSKSRINKNKWKALSEELRRDCPKCEYCLTKKTTQVHHLVSKYYHKSLLRFDVANLVCLCGKCHFIFHKNPVQTMRWLSNARNEDWVYLLRRLEETQSQSTDMSWLTSAAERLEGGV